MFWRGLLAFLLTLGGGIAFTLITYAPSPEAPSGNKGGTRRITLAISGMT